MQTNESAPKTTAAPVTTTSVAPQAYAQPDGRPSTVQAQSLVNAIDNSPRQVAQMKAVEAINESPRQVVQRMAIVAVSGGKKKKTIEASGQVADFKEGTAAGATGWIGVTKYESNYAIEDGNGNENTGKSRRLKNKFTTPEAGHVLGKQNGGNGGDPENVFAQDGGSNNSDYKAFEGRMRRDLTLYENTGGGTVTFESTLGGENIYQGNIADEAESSASEISSDEDSSSSSMSISEDSSDSN